MFEKIKSLFDIKLWKFLLVGVLNTLVGNGLSFLFLNLTPMGYIVSSLTSTILASVMSYFLNKYFTFQNKEKGIKPILRFSVNIAVCYFLAYVVFGKFSEWLLPLIFTGFSEQLCKNLAMVVGMCFFVGFNYLGQRLFAFREKK